MDIEKPLPPHLSSIGLNSKNPCKNDLWKSLLVHHINGNVLETNSEDTTLQGFSLLLETAFFHFKDVYTELLNTRKELEKVRHDWESSEQCCMKLKEELKKAQSDCTKCTTLQKDLNAAQERSNNFHAVLLNAIKTLNPTNGTKPQSDSQTKKACNMMTQALQGTQDMSLLDETLTGDSPVVDIWRCAKQKRSLETISSPNEIHGTPERQPFPKKSFRTLQRSQTEKKTPPPQVVVPESPANGVNTVQSPVKNSDAGNTDRKVLCDVSLNVQTTPKKGVTKSNNHSPILGNSHKKPQPGKGATPVPGDNSPLDTFCESPLIVKNRHETQDIPSPSLLNSEQFQENKASGIKGPLAALKSAGSSGSPQGPSKIVKLETITGDVSYERRPGGSGMKKMKQQKLSLSSFPRPKQQDISSFKEFNGGVRAQPSDLGVELLDEEAQLEKALQESLLEAERIKKEEKGLARLLQPSLADSTFYCSPANNQDDFIPATPQQAAKPSGKVSVIEKRSSGTLTESFQPKVTSTMVAMDSSMDMFVPDYHSTERNVLDETCTPNSNLDALVEEMHKPGQLSLSPPKRFETSFDRLPPREKTSQYKREGTRKKCDRKKLHGHGEHCCKDFYAENGVDPNKVSRHRDQYEFKVCTPSGYWKTGFPHSLEEKR